MASLTLGVNGPTQNIHVDITIADEDAARIMAWLMSPSSGYGTVTENVLSPDGATQSWVTRHSTPDEAATAYARATLQNIMSSTVEYEKAKAAEAAANAVKPIAPVVKA